MDEDDKRAIALWRLSVLGPLISARLEHGDKSRYFETASERTYELPSGQHIRLSPRTIESWYYAHRREGFRGLFPKDREDRGKSRVIRAELVEHILRSKRERPRRGRDSRPGYRCMI